MDFNTIAYEDINGYLNIFYDGQTTKISNDKVNSFELSNDILKYTTGLNEIHFFSKGKIF